MLLKAGLQFVRKNGFEAITCQAIADAAECSYNTVRRQWSNRKKLAVAIRDHAEAIGDKETFEAGKRATEGIIVREPGADVVAAKSAYDQALADDNVTK